MVISILGIGLMGDEMDKVYIKVVKDIYMKDIIWIIKDMELVV